MKNLSDIDPSRKTQSVEYMLTGEGGDRPRATVRENIRDHAVLLYGTEQSEYQLYKALKVRDGSPLDVSLMQFEWSKSDGITTSEDGGFSLSHG